MITTLFRRAFPAVLAVVALMITGCLDQTDTIEVHPDGRTTITAEFSGDAENFSGVVALPTAPDWTITQDEIDTVTSKKPQLHYTATIDVPYGRALPQTFAAANAADRDQQLQFPTEVKMWKEGNRMYYEFRRTYKARRYGSYMLTGWPYWDQDLEDSVVQKGIFNVSEQQREKYLDQFGDAYGYLQWRMHWQAMSDLVGKGLMADSIRSGIDSLAYAYLDSSITNERLLALLGKGEDSLDPALDSMTAEIDKYYERILGKAAGPDQAGLLSAYRESLAHFRHDYDITEALGAQGISVHLTLPGTLLDANGLIDPENKPNEVEWDFKGNDLHDRDIPLYARSVVVNK